MKNIRRLTVCRHNIHRYLARPLFLVLVAACMIGVSSCTTVSRAQFQCDNQINESLLLAIDLVEVSEREVQQIQQAGEDWFTSDARDELRHRIKTISVRGGCYETVDLQGLTSSEKWLKKEKGYGTLAIIAEYETISGDQSKPYMDFRPKAAWKGKTIVIRVHEDYLTVQGAL